MAQFSKKSLTLFLRNKCERQLILSLYNDTEREAQSMPPKQKSRFALGLVGQLGYDWQAEKVNEMKDLFGEANVYVKPLTKNNRPTQIDLLTTLPLVEENQFIVESNYAADTPTFRNSFGIVSLEDSFGNEIKIGETHPDIIQILPALNSIGAAATGKGLNPTELAVLPNGDTAPLDSSDNRLRLRVVDIKLTSEPGAYYFAEVVYYSITLAAWLIENNLDRQFVVVAAPAIWAGSHEASNLAKQFTDWKRRAYPPTAAEMSVALEDDLEVAVFDIYAPLLKRLLTEKLPEILKKPWRELNWFVDFNCKGCEFLGFPWVDKTGKIDNDPLHCFPTAESEKHLSQVFGLSRGASKYLSSVSVSDVGVLAATSPAAPTFDEHHSLRAKRSIVPFRAQALESKVSSVIPQSGGDAMMPKYPDLHVYLFLDYDLSSAITAAVGVRAFWREPLPFGSLLPPEKKAWTVKQGEDEVFLVDQRTLVREREEFLKFLRHLRGILNWVGKKDTDDAAAGRRDRKTQTSSYQIYLWDEAQRKHLIRLIGRHLSQILADPDLRGLAWLFPPPELLQNSADATRQSPITIVSNVIGNTIAVPVPHHYPLLDVVKTYKPDKMPEISVHPLYQEPMSDLLPAERIHEWWQRKGNWNEKQQIIKETSRRKVLALNLVTSRLETDLSGVLSRHAAPPVVRSPKPRKRIAPQSQLWLEYAKLNAALDGLEKQTIRSMPPHEREARTKSARLTKRLTGVEEQRALDELSKTLGRTIEPGPNLFVYKIRDGSYEVNARPGDIQYGLSPETHYGFLDEHPFRYVAGTSLSEWANRRSGETFATLRLTEVSVEAIDRINGYVALRGGRSCVIADLERESKIPLDFSKNAILDKVHQDFLTKKVELTLAGINYPASAVPTPRMLEALGLPATYPPGTSDESPASRVLWETRKVCAQLTGRDTAKIKPSLEQFLEKQNRNLDDSQWRAWEQSLSRCFSMIWGPPGTGKSKTLRAIILGAVSDAVLNKKSLRLLVTAHTYTAVDNVLLDVERELKEMFPKKIFDVFRIQSHLQELSAKTSAEHPALKQVSLNKNAPSPETLSLIEELENPTGSIVVVGCLPQQLHNLALAGVSKPKAKDTLRDWFNFILLDEVSQMDIATGSLVFSKLAENGTCVLAGDDLQLPPIQQAKPPLELEYLVGSAYNYFRHNQEIEPNALEVNYRSNRTIVELTKLAGYSASLQSNSPDLKINFVSDIPFAEPAGFPGELVWSPDFAKILDPNSPVVCFVYDDDMSSQTNEFEADSVASLIWLLKNHLSDKLMNERQPDGTIETRGSTTLYSDADFWAKAVGVVTPHRAQMSKIAGKLQRIFPAHNAEAVRTAIDTVERFQGQQRDVIIASFGLGDPDLISSEDEFLYNLNRFNVLSSRARAKFIVFVTRTLLEHLSNDVEVLNESRFLKRFAEGFCSTSEQISLGFYKSRKIVNQEGILRYK